LLLLTGLLAQVAPNYQPYSIKNPDAVLSTAQRYFISGSPLNFKQNAQFTLHADVIVYRLTLSLDKLQSGYLKITNWQVPVGAKLFIFNDNSSYTGPYLNLHVDEFVSGKFISDAITLEYVVPINVIFFGNFIIEKILPEYKTVVSTSNFDSNYKVVYDRERPKIMVTGYWPPTNEMVRHFSQDPILNPEGWQGDNWEGLGYDVVSFFPEFNPADCNNCGQGYGNLEVDYQDFSQDYWPIVEDIQPVGIITFSRGFNDMSWELENRLVNRTNWYDDYTAPLLPTPNPPDDTANSYYVRYTSLPVDNIISAILTAHLGLDPYLDNTNAGMFLSEFAGYHGIWYKEANEEDNETPCFAAGHIHVGAQVDWNTARAATEVSIRALIEYVNQFMIVAGDCNSDGEINILDVVALTGAILGNLELSPTQTAAADMDGNGELNILDIIAIVNLILSE